jgi:hypothetical protein
MTLFGKRTAFREDLGVWLRREKFVPVHRKLPLCMGRNRSQSFWCSRRYWRWYAEHKDRALFLHLRLR